MAVHASMRPQIFPEEAWILQNKRKNVEYASILLGCPHVIVNKEFNKSTDW